VNYKATACRYPDHWLPADRSDTDVLHFMDSWIHSHAALGRYMRLDAADES
jgi:hypothetical protein